MAAALTLRSVKGSPLLNSEVDNNFTGLNDFGNVINSNVGVLSNLTTQTKANVVNAINELQGNIVQRVGVTTGNISLTGNIVVNANDSTPAVRITQLGTGDAFVVEDSANPDATPFAISQDGRVCIGNVTTSATSALTITRLQGGSLGSGTLLLDNQTSGTSTPSRIIIQKSNTTPRLSSSAVNGTIAFNSYNTDGTVTSDGITHMGNNDSKVYTTTYLSNNIHRFDLGIGTDRFRINEQGISAVGNVTLGAPAARIFSDFSSATDISRTLTQTVTANSATFVGAIPSGNSNIAGYILYNNSNPTNASNVILTINNSQAALQTAFSGTGTALPLVLGTNNITRVTFNVAGGADVATGLRESRTAMAANDIDTRVGNYFTKTISGATTLTVSNVPSSGTAASFILDLTNGGSATITWWSGMKWAGGTAPTLTASGRDVLGFFTHDGGTTWTGLLLGLDVK